MPTLVALFTSDIIEPVSHKGTNVTRSTVEVILRWHHGVNHLFLDRSENYIEKMAIILPGMTKRPDFMFLQ